MMLVNPDRAKKIPSIEATASSIQDSTTGTHTVSLPANVSVGDLLIVQFTTASNPTVTWPAGWTVIIANSSGGTSVTCGVRYRIADGTEGSTISITTSTNQKSAHASCRIKYHRASAPIAAGAAVITKSTTTNPPIDPPNCNTTVLNKYLYIMGEGATTSPVTTPPWSVGTFEKITPVVWTNTTGAGASSLMGVYPRLLSSYNPLTIINYLVQRAVAWTFAVQPESTQV